MSNYWAIAIGINQYQHFQPLLYAQWDAQALWTYWIKEGGIPQTQCVLLTDSGLVEQMSAERVSPARSNKKTPDKTTIEQQLVELGHHRVGEEDTLWCFFSGYGLHHQDKDYLMPVDGNPNNVDQTGIAADAFFDTLAAFPTDRIIVLLDLKRSPDTLTDAQVPIHRLGDDIAKQAQKSGIATILASQPDQVSNETLTLRQGLFTATLLEGLRTHGCFQIGQLTHYLENRLPELSEYYWRPRQEPMAIVPGDQKRYVLLSSEVPQPAMSGARSGTASTGVDLGDVTLSDPDLAPNPLSSSDQLGSTVAPEETTNPLQPSIIQLPVLGQELSYKPQPSTSAVKTILPPSLSTPPSAPPNGPDDTPDEIPDNTPPEPIPVVETPDTGQDDSLLAQGLKYALPLLSALMMLWVLWLNWPALTKQRQAVSPDAETSSPVSGEANGESENAVGGEPGNGDGTSNGDGIDSGVNAPSDIAFPVLDEDADGNADSGDDNSSETSPETSSGNSDGDVTAVGGGSDSPEPDAIEDNSNNQDGNGDGDRNNGLFPNLFGGNEADGLSGDALAKAKASVAEGNYAEAATWLEQVPFEAQTREYEQLKAEVDAAVGQADQANREILNRAIATLNQARVETSVNQASDFGRAIAIANQIQPGQPIYDEAQQYVLRWGEVILDLAKARAQSGQYDKAIATVNLIEEDDLPLLYPKAQQLLAEWNEAVGVDSASQSIIDAAKEDIKRFPNQAFPYNRGIGKLREIDSDEPLYGEAQRLTNEWSQMILSIANDRAQQGDLALAINTAKYVPQDTAAYGDAQAAIAGWSQ